MKKLFSFFLLLLCLTLNANAQVTVSGALTGNGPYTTLAAAFDAINGGIQIGAIISVDISASTTETVMATLNSNTWLSLTIFSSGGPVSVTGPDTAVIKLEGADNVTIDGTPTLDGGSRDISIIGTSTATNSAGIWLAHGSSLADSNGARFNVIRNCEIACGVVTNATGSNASFGIFVGGATIGVTTQGRFNDNNQILQNRIIRSTHGINMIGGGATRLGVGNVINENIVGPDAFGPDQIRNIGIHVEFQNGCIISMNEVKYVGGPFSPALTGADRIGIGVGTNAWSATPGTTTGGDYLVTKNKVHHIVDQRTFSSIGIVVSTTRGGSPTNNLCANNEIYDILGNSTSPDQALGIGHNGNNGGDFVVFNSIYMAGDLDEAGATSASQTCGGIRVATTADAGVTVRNNSISVNLTSNTAALLKMCIQMPSAAYTFGTGVLDNNDYYFPPINTEMRTGCFGTTTLATTFFTTLGDWQGAFAPPQDANSISADPIYCLGGPNYLIPCIIASPLKSEAAPIAGVTTDILGEIRDATLPTIGAYEFDSITLPVELSVLTASVNNRDVTLYWTTALELNNSGFDIERRLVNSEWTRIGNVTGYGTSSTPHNYSFVDRGLATGKYNYRLKQIDFNGNFEYFNLNSEIGIGVPIRYDLSQNYPNPFNPSTKINFDIPFDGKVIIKLFDMSGKEVSTLVNEVKSAGYYTINFNATSAAGGLSSGVYFYTIKADNNDQSANGGFVSTKKMMLIK